jgi:hypothetical protein
MTHAQPMPHRSHLWLTLALWLAALPASADVTFRTQTTDSLRPAALMRGTVWLDDTSLRMEFARRDAPGRTSVVIFRSDRSLYWTLDPITRTYVEIDRAELERLGKRVRQARSEMQARLETLPPEQREKVAAMLEDMRAMETSTVSQEKLVPTDARETIDGHAARRYDLVLQTEVVGAVWVAEWAALELEAKDVAVFEKLAHFQNELIQTLGASAGAVFGSQPLDIFERVNGFPLRIRRIQDGRTRSETRLHDVRRLPAAADRFSIPEGYTRRAGPGTPTQLPPAPPGS